MATRHYNNHRAGLWLSCVVFACSVALVAGVEPVQATSGTIWTVDRGSDDEADGLLASHKGSLRFVLNHAQSGDTVIFSGAGDTIFVYSSLRVPAGVAVGRSRDEKCHGYNPPVVNIEAVDQTVNPVVKLGAGAIFHDISIVGGDNSMRIDGDGVDVCGVAFGLSYDGDGVIEYTKPPKHSALLVDGAAATVRRNYFGGPIVVTTRGDGTHIGDAINGDGDSNQGGGTAAVTIVADEADAAQRVTVRDPFPRVLQHLGGFGIVGGDDGVTHANNWAATPMVYKAFTADGFATVTVVGTTSPLAQVDIYLESQGSLVRQLPVVAGADGSFAFNGVLPGGNEIDVLVASTLNDPAFPSRVGSSSQLSAKTRVQVKLAQTALQVAPSGLLFAVPQGGAPVTQPLVVSVPSATPTLAWQSVVTTDSGAWLSATPASGSSTGIISVTADPAGLAPGIYSGLVIVSSTTQSATAQVTLTVQSAEPLLAALGDVVDLSEPPDGIARSGDLLRFSIVMTNIGAVEISDLHTNNVQVSSNVAVQAGSGAVVGGSGFTPDDTGFSGGRLAPGQGARFFLDARVLTVTRPGAALFSLEVSGSGIVAIPVVGRIRLTSSPVPIAEPPARSRLPLIAMAVP